MIELSDKERTIADNFVAFEAMLPVLMKDHRGEFALMRHGEVVDFYAKASEAHLTGLQRFADKEFSVQRVEAKALDLGFFSHARYSRIA